MFRNKTVFVLGAGASFEAGMPLGSELAIIISRNLDFRWDDAGHFNGTNRQFFTFLNRYGADTKLAQASSRGIRFSRSIDEYIDRHKDSDIERIGKLAIAYSILEYEGYDKTSRLRIEDKNRYNSLSLTKIAGTWYLEFARLLFHSTDKSNIDKLFDNLCIIDFNYDRCLDQFLRFAIRDAYNISTLEADRLLEELPHFRPYGTISKLRTEAIPDGLAFGANPHDVNMEAVIKRIKTYTEQIDSSAVAKIREAVTSAHTLVFLGFGFHESNMRLLTPKSNSNIKRVLATGKGVSDSDREVIANSIREICNSSYLSSSVGSTTVTDLTCAGLFQEYRLTLQAA